MSEDDKMLIRQIEEEVRRERYLKLWQQYGMYLVAGVVAIVAVIVVSLYSRLLSRQSLGKIVTWTLVFSILALMAFGLLLRWDFRKCSSCFEFMYSSPFLAL